MFKVENITKVIVVMQRGPDHVSVETNLPSPFPAGGETLCLKFETSPGRGESYARAHFSEVPIEVINGLNGVVYTIQPGGRVTMEDPKARAYTPGAPKGSNT